MNLFLDTSALVKIYVREADSDAVRWWVEQAAVVSVCRIAWAECHAAFAARNRLVPADEPMLAVGARAFAEDWPHLAKVEVNQDLVERAGQLAGAFALRGYDSVQLAAADLLHRKGEMPVAFGCFDQRLTRAAGILGIPAPPPFQAAAREPVVRPPGSS